MADFEVRFSAAEIAARVDALASEIARQLPRDALDYLSPRQRICYFFERAVSPGPEEAGT